jgi:hypothetical protein
MFIKQLFALLSTITILLIFTHTAVAKDVNLKGTYKWVRKKGNTSGNIVATFTQTGKNQWKAAFKFNWKKTPHVYTGTATGSLTDGKIEGKIFNDTKKRTFTFTGVVKNGVLKATHKEIKKRKGKEIIIDTGTIEMKI